MAKTTLKQSERTRPSESAPFTPEAPGLKAKAPPVAGAVAGYVRLSRLTFPPECLTLPQRRAHVDQLRDVRRRELQADAARFGEVITAWYDDMGVSGRGKYLDRRVDFARARSDAGRGALCVLYARDLSRLFRNVVQQELWFAEMEDLGVCVRAEDLPFMTDAATRRLVRQWMGAYHEYSSARLSALIAAAMRHRIRGKLSLGQGTSRWGLRYNPDTRAYDFDPDTADKARLVFETFNGCQGNMGRAAQCLNALIAAGDPRATHTPTGRLWTSDLVGQQVRAAAYRRIVKFAELREPAPDRIPEVVPAAAVAEADAWLAARRPGNLQAQERRFSRAPRFTYAFLLRCGYCGSELRPSSSRPKEGRTQWAAYRCSGADLAHACTMQFSVQQRRLHRLLGRALGAAFAAHAHDYLASQPRPAAAGPEAAVAALDQEAAQLKRRRERFLELFALEIITDPDELQAHLGRIDMRLAFLGGQRPLAAERPAREGAEATPASGAPPRPAPPRPGPPRPGPVPRAAFAELRRRFEEVWPLDWDLLHDPDKHALLTEMQARVAVRVQALAPRTRGQGRRPQRVGGAVSVSLELPTFGLIGMRALFAAETDEEMADYRRWHNAATHPPRVGPGGPTSASPGAAGPCPAEEK